MLGPSHKKDGSPSCLVLPAVRRELLLGPSSKKGGSPSCLVLPAAKRAFPVCVHFGHIWGASWDKDP